MNDSDDDVFAYVRDDIAREYARAFPEYPEEFDQYVKSASGRELFRKVMFLRT